MMMDKSLELIAEENRAIDNVETYQSYLNRIGFVCEHYTKHAIRMNEKDREVLHETGVRARFTAVVLKDLQSIYGLDIPERYDFSQELDKVVTLGNYLTSKASESIAISCCVEINDILRKVIADYYSVPVRRPFWKAF